MVESLIAAGFLAVMLVLAAGSTLGAETWLIAGFWLGAIGMGFGVPTGLLYHVALARSLRRVDALPAGWYWRPTQLHGRLPHADRRWVLGWCGAGALGFVIAVLGCVVTAIGVLRSL